MQNNITVCKKFEFSFLIETEYWQGKYNYKGVLHISGKEGVDRKALGEKVKQWVDTVHNAYVIDAVSDWGEITGKTYSPTEYDSLTLENLSGDVLNDIADMIRGILVIGCEYFIWLELWEGDEGIVTPILSFKRSIR